jgi:riboflavin synthase
MFTGLIQAVGTLNSINKASSGLILSIQTPEGFLATSNIGDSICVQGVCLTATTINNNLFTVDVSDESLRCTSMGEKKVGQGVNLERALTLSAPLGGHLVTGHVDGIGQIKEINELGEYMQITLQAPGEIAKYIARKGSICIDGVSLTVNNVEGNEFTVMVIPHTQTNTTINEYKKNTKVNLEVDMIARYVERLHHYSN